MPTPSDVGACARRVWEDLQRSDRRPVSTSRPASRGAERLWNLSAAWPYCYSFDGEAASLGRAWLGPGVAALCVVCKFIL